MSKSPDQSTLLWYRPEATSYRLLADSPDCFQHAGTVRSLGQANLSSPPLTVKEWLGWSSSSMTNLGLRIMLPILRLVPAGANNSFGSGGADPLRRLGPEDHHFAPGAYAETPLQYVCDNGRGMPERLALSLRYLHAGVEGVPIFICHRPREWMFSNGNGEGEYTQIFLCGSDYNKVGMNASDELEDGPGQDGTNQDARPLRDLILETIAETLVVDAAQVMASAGNLWQLGLDSISCLRIVHVFRNKTGVRVPFDLILVNFSVEAIERFLLDMGALSEPSN